MFRCSFARDAIAVHHGSLANEHGGPSAVPFDAQTRVAHVSKSVDGMSDFGGGVKLMNFMIVASGSCFRPSLAISSSPLVLASMVLITLLPARKVAQRRMQPKWQLTAPLPSTWTPP